MKKISGSVDAITGKPLYAGWNLHHLDEKHYDDLKPEKFRCLNRESHKIVHWLARYTNYAEIATNLVDIVREMRDEFKSQ